MKKEIKTKKCKQKVLQRGPSGTDFGRSKIDAKVLSISQVLPDI